MNRKLRSITIVSILVVIDIAFSYNFFKKHYIPYSACYKLSLCRSEFHPLAYRFINTEEEMSFWVSLFKECRKNETNIKTIMSSIDFDFNNHTYLIVYGAPVKNMYYSIRTTLFDDISPDYCSAWHDGKQCVFINYCQPTGYCYIYELDKNTDITGFNGC